MKKTFIVLLLLIICVLISFFGAYNTYFAEKKELNKYNSVYEYYYDKEIFGNELTTIINKVTDSNIKNNVEKDEKGNYIDNGQNSIKMDVYIIESDTVYPIEKIYSLGTDRFVENFLLAKFKCTKMEYHAESKKIKYMYFEHISG